MKTLVVTLHDDGQNEDYKEGEHGYIDGYCRGGDDRPYACVVIGTRIVMASLNNLKVIGMGKEDYVP